MTVERAVSKLATPRGKQTATLQRAQWTSNQAPLHPLVMTWQPIMAAKGTPTIWQQALRAKQAVAGSKLAVTGGNKKSPTADWLPARWLLAGLAKVPCFLSAWLPAG